MNALEPPMGEVAAVARAEIGDFELVGTYANTQMPTGNVWITQNEITVGCMPDYTSFDAELALLTLVGPTHDEDAEPFWHGATSIADHAGLRFVVALSDLGDDVGGDVGIALHREPAPSERRQVQVTDPMHLRRKIPSFACSARFARFKDACSPQHAWYRRYSFEASCDISAQVRRLRLAEQSALPIDVLDRLRSTERTFGRRLRVE